MADRADALAKRREALLAYVLTHMQGTGIQSLESDAGEWACKIVKKPPAVQIAADAVIPPQYMRTPPAPQPDKTAIKQALQAGESIPGVALVAGYRLAIK